MKPGDRIPSNKTVYSIIKDIAAGNRPNANVYLCEDENSNQFILKHFYDQPPRPNVSYGKYNHYGRRRDGSNKVFGEIKLMSKQHNFLINHLERFKFKYRIGKK